MLALLSKYLIVHRTVSIPSVGALKIIHVPAVLEVTDQVIIPPREEIQYDKAAAVSGSQIEFIARELKTDRAGAEQALEKFGRKFLNSIQKKPYQWGFGTFKWEHNEVVFKSDFLSGAHIIRAKKIIREDARHNVRVGENNISSSFQTAEAEVVGKRKNSLAIDRNAKKFYNIIGWILLFAALLFIAWHFYQNGFSVSSSGNQQKVIGR